MADVGLAIYCVIRWYVIRDDHFIWTGRGGQLPKQIYCITKTAEKKTMQGGTMGKSRFGFLMLKIILAQVIAH